MAWVEIGDYVNGRECNIEVKVYINTKHVITRGNYTKLAARKGIISRYVECCVIVRKTR